MRLDLMIEGQDGVTWPQWQALAAACEQHSVSTLLRSDHYMNPSGRHSERGCLDALGTAIALGATTTKLRLGTLVSPVTFRHPSILGKLATTADQVSGGRFELGLGTGWNVREHAAYGFSFADPKTRTRQLAEQLEILVGSWTEGAFSFDGEHYKVQELDAQPKPVQKPHVPVIMGGRAGRQSVALAARFATEYNTVFAAPADVLARKARVENACEAAGREPIAFSVMMPVIVGLDQDDLRARIEQAAPYNSIDTETMLKGSPEGYLVGTVDQVVEQLRTFRDAGISRVICKHFAFTDLEFIELLGGELQRLIDE